MARVRRGGPVHPFDTRYGTDTSGLIPGEVIARGTTAMPVELTAYYGIAPSILSSVLDLWLQRTAPQAPVEETVFLDVGAGKGRAMLLASRYPFLRVEGVELNGDLAAIAQRNIDVWSRHAKADRLAPVVLHHADALTYPLPAEPTIAFLFHPFERTLMRRFLRHIENSRRTTNAPFDLLYVNAEHASMLEGNPAFKLLWKGRVPMSTDDHIADLAEIAQQEDYGSTGDELCDIYRYTGRGMAGTEPAA